MRRTQIYLDTKIIRLLTSLSNKTGKTRSELIRDAINDTYDDKDVKSVIEKLGTIQSFSSNTNSSSDKLRSERKW